MKDKHKGLLIGIAIAIGIGTVFGFIYKNEKKWNKVLEERKVFRAKIKNAQCRVLRENDTDLIGVTCTPMEGDIWEIKTLTGKFVSVHKSRIRPNGQNNLIMPYKGK